MSTLPEYFLADLPEEATLSVSMLREAVQTLRQNRERHLAERSTQDIVHLIAEVAGHWLNPQDELRRQALSLGPKETGFSTAVLETGLDHFFRQITVDNLENVIQQDLGHPAALDDFVSGHTSPPAGHLSRCYGHAFWFHILAGNLPIPGLMTLILGLLTKSAQLAKCPHHQTILTRLFAHAVYREDQKLGSCLEVAAWPGGQRPDLESFLLEACDAVTVTGKDATIQTIRTALPNAKPCLSYGQRFSLGYLARQALTRSRLEFWTQAAAEDVAAWDQLGCLSPHCFYVESGGAIDAAHFAEQLAHALAQIEKKRPRGTLDVQTAAQIQARRNVYEIRADASDQTQIWSSPESTAWTVVYENEPVFSPSCLHRFVYVKPVQDLKRLLQHLEPWRAQISTLGLAAVESEARQWTAILGSWGVPRICEIGAMQRPPPAWRHDGRPALADMVRWVDWHRSQR